MTALYKMGQPGHVDLLRSHVALGGDLWLAGGGAANASLSPTDVRSNNAAGGGKVFSAVLDTPIECVSRLSARHRRRS